MTMKQQYAVAQQLMDGECYDFTKELAMENLVIDECKRQYLIGISHLILVVNRWVSYRRQQIATDQ